MRPYRLMLAAALSAACSPVYAAAIINYHIQLDTSPLGNATYALGLRVTEGLPDVGGLTIDVMGFDFGSGGVVGPPDTLNAGGGLPSGVGLNTGFPTPTWLQAFVPGDALTFNVFLLADVLGFEHRRLSVAILPLSLTGQPPMIANSLDSLGNLNAEPFFQVALDAHDRNGLTDFRTTLLSDHATHVGDILLPAAAVTATPEPSTVILLGSALIVVALLKWVRH